MQALSDYQIQDFIHNGYIKLENAFPSELAKQCLAILWKATGCDPGDRSTWVRAVIRLGEYTQQPFQQAANTPLLHTAFNQLVGVGRWLPRKSLGTFPIRFPSKEDPNDTGWHVEASFPGEDANDYMSWHINVASKGRALLMLFLFSDVEEQDAPTRIRIGSHWDVAKLLAPYGSTGLPFSKLAGILDVTENRKEVLATGKGGDVYLCHPFLVHAAQPHHGKNPRFMAQPPLIPVSDMQIYRQDGNYSPVEIAIRKGLEIEGNTV